MAARVLRHLVLIGVSFAASPAYAQCTYQVTPPGTVASHSGDVLTGTVTTASGCTWTAFSLVPWAAVSRNSSTFPEPVAEDFNFVNSGSGQFFVHIGSQRARRRVDPDLPMRRVRVIVRDGAGTTITSFTASQHFAPAPLASVPPRTDFDGDGRADATVWRPGAGVWFPLGSAAFFASGAKNGVTPVQWGIDAFNDQPVSGDYDGDAKADVAIWRPGEGIWYILTLTSNFTSYLAVEWGMAGDVPVPADYDADRKMDIAVWRPSTGVWFILTSTTNYSYASAIVRQWGAATDRPLPADYDGDGSYDIAVWRPANGVWYILRSWLGLSTAVPFAVQWGSGASGHVPFGADFSGDGAADLTVWHPDSGNWYPLISENGTPSIGANWGQLNDIPVVADYNGDGFADFAVWRPSNGVWFVRTGFVGFAGQHIFTTQWGNPPENDAPVPRQ